MYVQRFVVWRYGLLSVFAKTDIFGIVDETATIKVLSELTNAYLKEQTEYMEDQINKIRHSVDDRQSRITRQTVNEVSKRKSATRAKLKAARQEERTHLWKEHFKN